MKTIQWGEINFAILWPHTFLLYFLFYIVPLFSLNTGYFGKMKYKKFDVEADFDFFQIAVRYNLTVLYV